MSAYTLGIDVGTTYTAAAVCRDGRAEMLPLGSTNVIVPTVVVLRDDGEVLVGEAAERRAVAEPTRVAREFKRRMGDPTPITVGGTPYGAEALIARVVEAVVREATARQGAAPAHVVLTHPASWTMYKTDLLAQAARLAGLTSVSFLSEPQAAAAHYATGNHLEPGDVVAVYDLGGGTFDAAVVQRTAEGFELLGVPEGIERFGGIDIDRAVLARVDELLAGEVQRQASGSDAATLAASARLRDEVRAAKEALSNDRDAVVPVLLPGLQAEARIDRADVERMIRPRLVETVEALRRTLRSAGLDWPQVTAVLAVGGSSRIPVVREVVREWTGRPVAVDTHAKHAIALGAAEVGWSRAAAMPAPLAPPVVAPPVALATPPPPAAVQAAVPQAAAPHSARPVSTGRRGLVVGGVLAAAVVAVAAVALLVTRSGGSGAAEARTGATDTIDSESPTTSPTNTGAVVTLPVTLPGTAAPAPTTVGVPVTVPPTANPAGTIDVVDSTGSFVVTVPADAKTLTATVTLGGIVFAQVSASAQLDAYIAGDWTATGVSVLVAPLSNVDAPTAAGILDPGAGCTSSTGPKPYATAAGNGVIVEYEGCGDGTGAQSVIALEIPSAAAVVVAAGSGPGPASAGLTALVTSVLATVRAAS